ncbi:MAG: Na(+)-translocating NADH-quinone reductase subunit F [Flavobacteriaceae bacterium]
MRPLTNQELHNLAMNIVGRQLEAEGYEFRAVNSKPGKNPQFVCSRGKKLHFIVVRPVAFPNDPKVYDESLMKKVADHAQKFNGHAFYAGVGLSNAKDRTQPVLLDQEYIVDFHGLIGMNDG